jgi:hypothetical protein
MRPCGGKENRVGVSRIGLEPLAEISFTGVPSVPDIRLIIREKN